jgi:hypothetical protein
MGNIVYHKIPDKVFNIFLHSPWAKNRGVDTSNYPINGAIDCTMKDFEDKSVGFDVKGSPFGNLTDDSTYYSLGHDRFTLSSFCDGYIFQKHFSDYEGCAVDSLFITEDNIQEAREYCPNLKARQYITSPQAQIESMAKDANMEKRFSFLE